MAAHHKADNIFIWGGYRPVCRGWRSRRPAKKLDRFGQAFLQYRTVQNTTHQNFFQVRLLNRISTGRISNLPRSIARFRMMSEMLL